MQLTEKTENNFLNNCIYCNFGTYIKFGDENVPHSLSISEVIDSKSEPVNTI